MTADVPWNWNTTGTDVLVAGLRVPAPAPALLAAQGRAVWNSSRRESKDAEWTLRVGKGDKDGYWTLRVDQPVLPHVYCCGLASTGPSLAKMGLFKT